MGRLVRTQELDAAIHSAAPKPVEQPPIPEAQRPLTLRIEALEERVAPGLVGLGK